MSNKTRLARLKPCDPKRGFVLKRYSYRGIKFQEDRGWLRVDLETATYLEGLHQIAGDPHSPAAFDVCTDEEARKLEQQEAKEDKPTLATDAVRVAKPRADKAETPPTPKPTRSSATTKKT